MAVVQGPIRFLVSQEVPVRKWLRGETLQLEIGKTQCEGTVFLNGHRLEGVCRGNIPLCADVTNLLKLEGENELIVFERGDIALAREDYVDRYTPDALDRK